MVHEKRSKLCTIDSLWKNVQLQNVSIEGLRSVNLQIFWKFKKKLELSVY